MKTTKTVTTVQKQYITNAGPRQKTLPTTTHVISQGGQSGLRHSLRGSAGGKIWKKTVLGDKFEYSKQLPEKRNYILYAHGMGHEKRQIEELEQIPQPPGKNKIVESWPRLLQLTLPFFSLSLWGILFDRACLFYLLLPHSHRFPDA